MNTRAVIVGAGIGGLVSAIELARAGVQVQLFDRGAAPGGKLRQVQVGGRSLDAGPSVLTMRWVFDQLFARAGADLQAELDLQPAPLLARHAFPDGGRLDLYADLERTVDAIGQFAGAAEARGYRAYCRYTERLYETAAAPFMLQQRPTLGGALRTYGPGALLQLWHLDPFRPLMRALHDFFRDPRLRQLFGRYATYCGGSPYTAPATLNLVNHVERQGIWLVPGGMQALAAALARLAERLGVAMHLGQDVQRILVRGHRACGVALADGTEVGADAVVLGADPGALASLLPGTARPPAASVALSAITLHVLARRSSWPLMRHNVFFNRDYAGEFAAIWAGQLPSEPTVYVCAQDRDGQGTCTSADERLLCLVNAPAGLPALTPRERERCTENLMRRLRAAGLHLELQAAPAMTSPADFARLFPGSGGALYGPPPQSWRSFFNRPSSRHALAGLYLAGGSVHPGPGLPMAALSGCLAAAALCADSPSTTRRRRAAMPGGTSTATAPMASMP